MEQQQAKRPGFLTIANGLTYSRLILLPIAIWGISRHHGWVALIAVALTVATDLVDGRLARRFGQASAFGKTLDSTIDFVFIYSLFIALYAGGELMTSQFFVIYLGMLTILTLQMVGTADGAEEGVVQTTLGKAVGAAQFFYLLWRVLVLVLAETPKVYAIDSALFVVLGIAVMFNAIECVLKLRKMV